MEYDHLAEAALKIRNAMIDIADVVVDNPDYNARAELIQINEMLLAARERLHNAR